MLFIFLKGLLIGFSIAAPVGPIGILCINRSLQDGFKYGFVSGCGAATADGLYGCIAGFGLTFIAGFLVNQQSWIHFLGGIFLFYLGFKILLATPEKNTSIEAPKSLLRSYASTLFLTATNPITIISFTAIFAGFGISNSNPSYSEACLLVMGVIVGSLSWWLLLSSTVALVIRHKISDKTLQWINCGAGIVLMIFGTVALVSWFYS